MQHNDDQRLDALGIQDGLRVIRPPSNIRSYDDFFSGDPALVQLADDATEDEKKAHANKLRVARETGDWAEILVEGQQPTRFEMQTLKGAQFRRIVDDLMSKRIGSAEANQLAFLCAIKSVVNLGDVKVTTINDERLGTIAKVDVANALDAITPDIVNELGGQAIRRAQAAPPK